MFCRKTLLEILSCLWLQMVQWSNGLMDRLRWKESASLEDRDWVSNMYTFPPSLDYILTITPRITHHRPALSSPIIVHFFLRADERQKEKESQATFREKRSFTGSKPTRERKFPNPGSHELYYTHVGSLYS